MDERITCPHCGQITIVDGWGCCLCCGEQYSIVQIKTEPDLTFHQLRAANLSRMPQFKNSKGEPVHSRPDGSDWSAAQWLQAVTGELGEYANIRKKYERGDIDFNTFMEAGKRELADVVVYLDILASQLGIDLANAVRLKFNEVSERVGSNVTL